MPFYFYCDPIGPVHLWKGCEAFLGLADGELHPSYMSGSEDVIYFLAKAHDPGARRLCVHRQ
jgi:hypothetical protein